MKLPNCENAYVSPSKLSDYLLSQVHPVGKSKARFFRAHGFDETSMVRLQQALLKLACTYEVVDLVGSPYGVKYVVEGGLETPLGKLVSVRTVWIVEAGDQRPRFLTAYPS